MPGPRVFTIDEARALISKVERHFTELDELKKRMRTLNIRINALEMIWGGQVHRDDNPDHGELEHHLAEMKSTQEQFERHTKAITKIGGHVKSVDPALVDFYGVKDGRLIFWCWTRGESTIAHWHHIDKGFAERQPI
ncbi:MAG: DUF2203 domain-containing protein [Planctomycetota bacterium]